MGGYTKGLEYLQMLVPEERPRTFPHRHWGMKDDSIVSWAAHYPSLGPSFLSCEVGDRTGGGVTGFWDLRARLAKSRSPLIAFVSGFPALTLFEVRVLRLESACKLVMTTTILSTSKIPWCPGHLEQSIAHDQLQSLSAPDHLFLQPSPCGWDIRTANFSGCLLCQIFYFHTNSPSLHPHNSTMGQMRSLSHFRC